MKKNLLISAAMAYLDKDKFLKENTETDNITTLLNDSDPDVRKTAFTEYGSDEGITPNHINIGLSDPHWKVRYAALNHEGSTADHVNIALNDPDDAVRSSAAEHRAATPEQLHRALSDPKNIVRMAAITNKNVGVETLRHAFYDDDQNVRHTAVDAYYNKT